MCQRGGNQNCGMADNVLYMSTPVEQAAHLEVPACSCTLTGGLPHPILVSLPSTGEAALLSCQVVEVVDGALRAICNTSPGEVGVVTALRTGGGFRTSSRAIVPLNTAHSHL